MLPILVATEENNAYMKEARNKYEECKGMVILQSKEPALTIHYLNRMEMYNAQMQDLLKIEPLDEIKNWWEELQKGIKEAFSHVLIPSVCYTQEFTSKRVGLMGKIRDIFDAQRISAINVFAGNELLECICSLLVFQSATYEERLKKLSDLMTEHYWLRPLIIPTA